MPTNQNNNAHEMPVNDKNKKMYVSARFVNVFVVQGTCISHYKTMLLGGATADYLSHQVLLSSSCLTT